jgi:hypothetical protein
MGEESELCSLFSDYDVSSPSISSEITNAVRRPPQLINVAYVCAAFHAQEDRCCHKLSKEAMQGNEH